MSNKVVTLAIQNLNDANMQAAANKASALIVRISGLQTHLAGLVKTEAELKAELNKLQTPDITDVSILGTSLPTTGANLNQQTIAKAIEALQKGKQGRVMETSDRLAQGIATSQEEQANTQKNIDKLVAELTAITPEVVTESEITGA
jgi:hypothetical protein